jgi:bifunctional non-homologous end joining protein LigD
MTDSDALEEYRSKRRFDKTSEPSGEERPETYGAASNRPGENAPRRLFVVQKHDASRLHYDFRLEMDGVLKSWAIPKGPSLDPSEKRLAVMVEDHPLEYGTFEGTIPEGEYGAGTVMVWDTGWWAPDVAWMKEGESGRAGTKSASNGAKGQKKEGFSSPQEALSTGELKFVVHGEKLSGSWALIKTKWRGENNWLLIKHRDDAARPGSDIEQEAPDSAASGRSLEEIAGESRVQSAPAPAGRSGDGEIGD